MLNPNDQESLCVYDVITVWYGTIAFPSLSDAPNTMAPIIIRIPESYTVDTF